MAGWDGRRWKWMSSSSTGRCWRVRLGFTLLLKFYTRSGRFPRGRSELPQEAVDFVARQMKVPAGDLGFYEWSGSTIEYHRAQARRHLGYRERGVTDAERLTAWLAEHVTQAERSPDRCVKSCWTGAVPSGWNHRRGAGLTASSVPRCGWVRKP